MFRCDFVASVIKVFDNIKHQLSITMFLSYYNYLFRALIISVKSSTLACPSAYHKFDNKNDEEVVVINGTHYYPSSPKYSK